MLTGKPNVFRPQLRWHFQSERHSIFGVGLYLGNSQGVKLEHGLQALEVIEGLKTGRASVVGFARRGAELTDTFGRLAATSRTGHER